MTDTNELKKIAGYRAAEFVEDGMVVGIGSGSTIAYVIEALGKRVAEEGLNIVGVPTSDKTRRTAAKLGIPMYNVDDVDHIDLTIDGADEIDPESLPLTHQAISGLLMKVSLRQS